MNIFLQEENKVKGGKDFGASSKKCVMGICSETGLGSDGLSMGGRWADK